MFKHSQTADERASYRDLYINTIKSNTESYKRKRPLGKWFAMYNLQGLAFAIGSIILLITFIAHRYANLTKPSDPAEDRLAIIAALHEDGITTFADRRYLEMTTSAETDPHQTIEIIGLQTTNEANIYYLIDQDGYTSTLTIPNFP